MAGVNGCWNYFCVASDCGPAGTTHVDATGEPWTQDPPAPPRTVDNAPHLMVTWSNAITTRPGDSECFADRDAGLAAAADGRRPWNNTRVDTCWHEAHDQAAERAVMRGEQPHGHTWGVICRRCAEVSAHRDASEAAVLAARDAAGDQHLHAVTS